MSYLDVLLVDVEVNYGQGNTANFNGPVRINSQVELKHYRKGIPLRIVESEIVFVEQSISFVVEEINQTVINEFLLQFNSTPTEKEVTITGTSLLSGSVHTISMGSALITAASMDFGGKEPSGLAVTFTNVGENSMTYLIT